MNEDVQFTDAEERFIQASIETLRATDRELRAKRQFDAAAEVSTSAARELARDDLEYVRDLVLESARRGGFDADSEVVAQIHEAYEEVVALQALVAGLNEAALGEIQGPAL